MSTIGLISVLVALGGGTLLLIAVATAFDIGDSGERPVGPWKAQRQDIDDTPTSPTSFRSLVHGEAFGWRQERPWERLQMQLDELEQDFGGVPPERRANFDEDWLEQRLVRIEQLAGPMPAPMDRPVVQRSTPFWKRWFS